MLRRKADTFAINDLHRFCFLASGSSIKVYVISSCQLVSSLDSIQASTSPGNFDSTVITGLFLNPSNSLQVITTSLDGHIRIWDYLDGSILRSINLGHPITCAACSTSSARNTQDSIFVSLFQGTKESKGSSHVYEVSLKRTSSRRVRLGRAKGAFAMSVSNDGQHLVILSKRRIHIVTLPGSLLNASQLNLLKENFVAFDGFSSKSPHTFSSLAIHPGESYFVTGDTKGQIRYWYILTSKDLSQIQASLATLTKKVNSFNSVPRKSTAMVHWHAHPVSSLLFTSNGAYLLSGGEEGVLVAWQVSSRHREYVPRLGAPIASVSIGGGEGREQEFVARLTDGNIVFVGAGTLKVIRTIAGVKSGKQMSSS